MGKLDIDKCKLKNIAEAMILCELCKKVTLNKSVIATFMKVGL
jgi:hypothetical protein